MSSAADLMASEVEMEAISDLFNKCGDLALMPSGKGRGEGESGEGCSLFQPLSRLFSRCFRPTRTPRRRLDVNYVSLLFYCKRGV